MTTNLAYVAGPMKRIAAWSTTRDVWETEQGDLFSGLLAVYSATWPPSGMTRSGVAFELPTSAPHMRGSGSSLLPTLSASDARGPGRHGTGGQDLRTVVATL